MTWELTAEGWRDAGELTWLLSSAGATGRSADSGELVSISWADLAGAVVDMRRELVVVYMGNGWSGRLSGPGVLPIAAMVAAALRAMAGPLGTARPRPVTNRAATATTYPARPLDANGR